MVAGHQVWKGMLLGQSVVGQGPQMVTPLAHHTYLISNSCYKEHLELSVWLATRLFITGRERTTGLEDK